MATVTIQKRIGKRGTKYSVRYTDPITRKRKYYGTFLKLKEAQKESDELKSLINSGRSLNIKKEKLSPMTFSEVADSLKEEWDARVIRRELTPKTHSDYCIWLNRLERIFGKKLLCQITTEEIISFRDQEIDRKSIINANRYLRILKYVFKHGMNIKALFENPVKEIKLLNESSFSRNRYLLPKELDSLIEATQKTRGKYYLPAIILLGAEHGASKQEILSLKWPEINFEYGSRGTVALFRTKNKMQRTDFLMPRTHNALENWKAHLEYTRHRRKITKLKSDYVFCRLDGTPIKNFNKAWWNVLKIAGIRDFHFHDLRHTFCSNLLLSGANLKDVKEMIGHNDITMTDRYSHLSGNHKLRLQEQLAEQYINGSS